MICGDGQRRSRHEHDDRVMAIAKELHRSRCGSHDGRRNCCAERWDKVGELHQHCHAVEVENFFFYAKRAGHPLCWGNDLEEAKLTCIEVSNPGIDMDEVRAYRRLIEK